MSESPMMNKENSQILSEIDNDRPVYIITRVAKEDGSWKKEMHVKIDAMTLKQMIMENLANKYNWEIIFTQEGWSKWAKVTKKGVQYMIQKSTLSTPNGDNQ